MYEIQYWDYNYKLKKFILKSVIYDDYEALLMWKNFCNEHKDLVVRRVIIREDLL